MITRWSPLPYKAANRRTYIETLAQRHAEAMRIPIERARSIVEAVAVSADKERGAHLLSTQEQFFYRGERYDETTTDKA